jgi:Ca2+-binding EF-hand superfamily protein
MDWDRSGTISRSEFRSYLEELKKGEDISIEDVMEAFKNMDKDGNNMIHWEEFYVSATAFRVAR